MQEKKYFVYIMTNKKYGTFYVGVTNDLLKRVCEHQQNLVRGFTQKHHIHQLVYFEVHADITEAICREKLIKRWNRNWKINLIEQRNPHWFDLSNEIIF